MTTLSLDYSKTARVAVVVGDAIKLAQVLLYTQNWVKIVSTR